MWRRHKTHAPRSYLKTDEKATHCHKGWAMGRMSRQKGKRGERECAAELGQLLGLAEGAARRGVQFAGGPDSPDVVLNGVAIHVEAKRVERLQLWAAIEQAKKDSPPGKTPVVWHKSNRRASVVIVETAMLVELAREIVRATS